MSQVTTATASRIALPEIKFRDMSRLRKFGFVVQVCIFFITFGFAYPNILVD